MLIKKKFKFRQCLNFPLKHFYTVQFLTMFTFSSILDAIFTQGLVLSILHFWKFEI